MDLCLHRVIDRWHHSCGSNRGSSMTREAFKYFYETKTLAMGSYQVPPSVVLGSWPIGSGRL
jgi:hypothetical protein